jgi:hypothetical protein
LEQGFSLFTVARQHCFRVIPCQATPQWLQRLLYCDVESKWKNYHINTFPGQSLSKGLEEAMELSQDRLLLELEVTSNDVCN